MNKHKEFTNLVYLTGMTKEAIARKSGIPYHRLKKIHLGHIPVPDQLIVDLRLVLQEMNAIWGEET